MELENSNDQLAITQLYACGQVINDITAAIEFMLLDVQNAGMGVHESNILTAWNNGKDHVGEHRNFADDVMTETTDFMSSKAYTYLDSDKKIDYWDAVSATTRALDVIDEQLRFYTLLSGVAHMEQTVDFLSRILKEHKNTLLYRELSSDVDSRNRTVKRRKIKALRDRLHHEVTTLVREIGRVTLDPHFESLTRLGKQEFYEKWKVYQKMLLEIYDD